MSGRIITVGLSPCWDLTCTGRNIEWNMHPKLTAQQKTPAGKALNISRALAWMNKPSVAAGLWGAGDIEQMRAKVKEFAKGFIDIQMTPVPGSTRQNVTILDTAAEKEMHLRAPNPLPTADALEKLSKSLDDLVRKTDLVVFAGSMPAGQLLAKAVDILASIAQKARVAVDTSGPALSAIAGKIKLFAIKPNLEELSSLAGCSVEDNTDAIETAARKFTDTAQVVLVSRGPSGVTAVTRDSAASARCLEKVNVLNTVGAGDYLLAGFLSEYLHSPNIAPALKSAVTAATARVTGSDQRLDFDKLNYKINVEK